MPDVGGPSGVMYEFHQVSCMMGGKAEKYLSVLGNLITLFKE